MISLGAMTAVGHLNHWVYHWVLQRVYHWWQLDDWSKTSSLKIHLMSFVMLAPVLLSLKSCFLWSFVTVFFNIKIKHFFCLSVTIQGSSVCDLFPWSRFSGDLCNQSVSVVLLNIQSSATQPGRLSWVLVWGFFGLVLFFPFFLHFEGLAFLIFFHILKWLERLVL